jgi:hypothetical protein
MSYHKRKQKIIPFRITSRRIKHIGITYKELKIIHWKPKILTNKIGGNINGNIFHVNGSEN